MKNIVLGLIVLLFLSSCFGEKVEEEENLEPDNSSKLVKESSDLKTSIPKWYKLYNDFSTFSFIYPEAWDLSVESWLLHAIASNYDNEKFLKSVSFTSQDFASKSMEFNKYYRVNLNAIKNSFKSNSWELISEENVDIAWLKWKKLVYTLSLKWLETKITQYFLHKSGKSYVITFTNNKLEDFSEGEVKNIMENFKLK